MTLERLIDLRERRRRGLPVDEHDVDDALEQIVEVMVASGAEEIADLSRVADDDDCDCEDEDDDEEDEDAA